jgi:uncharacterized RDD family membrane protein YckC
MRTEPDDTEQAEWEYGESVVPLNVNCPANADESERQRVTKAYDAAVMAALARVAPDGWQLDGPADADSMYTAGRLKREEWRGGTVLGSVRLRLKRRAARSSPRVNPQGATQAGTGEAHLSSLSAVPRGVPLEARVGFGPRVGGQLIDAVIASLVGFIGAAFVVGVVVGLAGGPLTESEWRGANLLGQLSSYGFILGYYVYWWGAPPGWPGGGRAQTIGQRLVGVRVVRDNGQAMGWSTSVVRTIGLLLSVLPYGLGLLWVVWDKQRQGWHDKMAGTCVVRADWQPAAGDVD